MLSHIAIVGAMENEVGFLRKSMAPPSRAGDRYAVGTIGNKVIMLLRTGIGPDKTTRRLTETEWTHPPHAIVSIGCGGALSPDIEVGDAVIADRIINAAAEGRSLSPSPELAELARACCQSLMVPFRSGTTVSTAGVAAGPEDKMALAANYDAIAVDMESARVAEWAANQHVPMLSIRTISDALNDSIPPEAGTLVDPKGKIMVRKTFSLFLSRPGLFVDMLRLKRNLDTSLKVLEGIVMSFIRRI